MTNQKVILYSTGCPQCRVLKAKLDAKAVPYEVCSDIEKMKELGITSVPMVQVDEDILNMKDALSWVKEGV